MTQHPFKLSDIEAISVAPLTDRVKWLLNAESSVEFLRRNAQNDEIVIYASAGRVLIHGVLAMKRRLTHASLWLI